MILEEETFKRFGYYPCDLRPHSHKRCLAACDDCGKIRETSKNEYHSLCISCVQKGKRPSKETRRKISNAMKGRSLSEETRKMIREATKEKHNAKKNNHLGTNHAQQIRRKISNAKKGRHLSE